MQPHGPSGDEHTLYREWTRWPGWVGGLLWGAVLVTCYSILTGGRATVPLGARLLAVALVAGIGALARVLLGGLAVLVQRSSILVHLGSARSVTRRVPFEEIQSVRAVRYRPLRDFGGWGLRGWGKRKAWTARGDQAVALTLTEDRELLIGSDRPERLEERIRAAQDAWRDQRDVAARE